MDYNRLLQFHIEKGSQATIAVIEVPWQEANRFGIMNTNESKQILEFEEKPKNPKNNLASMGVYLFNWKLLKDYLKREEEDSASSNDFGKNIIPKMLMDGVSMFAYPFYGYWKDVGTVDSLWEANMDLLGDKPAFSLNDSRWKIYAGNANHPPQYIATGATVKQSLVNEGCTIFGSVEHSVLSYNVQVGFGTNIKNSVIMPDVRIGENVMINRAIIASNTVIEDGEIVGSTEELDNITLIGDNQRFSLSVEKSILK